MPGRPVRRSNLGGDHARQPARLWFASFAYVLLCAVRRIGLAHTQFAEATCGTIRLKLLKLAGLVRISARRIKFALASACPYADEWRLAAAPPRQPCLRRRRDANKTRQLTPRPTGDPEQSHQIAQNGATDALARHTTFAAPVAAPKETDARLRNAG